MTPEEISHKHGVHSPGVMVPRLAEDVRVGDRVKYGPHPLEGGQVRAIETVYVGPLATRLEWTLWSTYTNRTTKYQVWAGQQVQVWDKTVWPTWPS